MSEASELAKKRWGMSKESLETPKRGLIDRLLRREPMNYRFDTYASELEEVQWAIAIPGTLLALVAAAALVGSQIGERVSHGADSAVIPETATELSKLPEYIKADGRTFLLAKRPDGSTDPIFCADGLPPVTLHDLGKAATVFCKGDLIPSPEH